MGGYRLSRAADADIDALYAYSIEQFGLDVARRYLDQLFDRFERIALQPALGRVYDWIAPSLRRYEHTSHSIYYRIDECGDVIIVRVLGARQDPARHIDRG